MKSKWISGRVWAGSRARLLMATCASFAACRATRPSIPLYIFSAKNAKDAGVPADFDKGFGDQHIAGFNALWGLY
jgi:hypothetical protein